MQYLGNQRDSQQNLAIVICQAWFEDRSKQGSSDWVCEGDGEVVVVDGLKMKVDTELDFGMEFGERDR